MRTYPALRHAVRLLGSLLLLGGFVQSCSKPDTILLVKVDADPALTDVTQLKVRVLVGEAVSQFMVPTNPSGPISFPTSFTVEIARSNSGPVNVTVTAMGNQTGMGTTNLPSINVGSENVVNVYLSIAATPPDGGVDSGGMGGMGGKDASVDAPTDVSHDAPGETGRPDVPGSDAIDSSGAGGSGVDGSGMGGSGMGGMGMGGSGMGGMGMGGSGMGGSGMGGSGMGGSGMGGSGMGGSGTGGDTGVGGSGVGGDMGTAGDAGTDTSDASDANDASDAELDAPTDL